MYAYSELYISSAQDVLGKMLEYAVYDLNMKVEEIYKAFLNSGIAERFGVGEPKFTVGMSGIELALQVMHCITGEYVYVEAEPRFERSAEYWAGWAIAYYEWYRNIPFKKLDMYIPIQEIVNMYHPYHEADITKFVQEIDRRIERRIAENI